MRLLRFSALAAVLAGAAACAAQNPGPRLMTRAQMEARAQRPVAGGDSLVTAAVPADRVGGGPGAGSGLRARVPVPLPPVAAEAAGVDTLPGRGSRTAGEGGRDLAPGGAGSGTARLAGYTGTPSSGGAARRANAPVPDGRWIRPGDNARRLPMEFEGALLTDVIAYIAGEARVAIVHSNEKEVVQARVTMNVPEVYWHLGLEAALEVHQLRAVQEPSGIITVMSAKRAEASRQPLPVELRYTYAREILPALQQLITEGADSTSDGVTIFGDPENSRRLIVNASADKIAKVRTLIAQLDKKPITVTTEVQLVSVLRENMQRLGISYSLVPGGARDSLGRAVTGVRVQEEGQSGIRGGGPALSLRRLAGMPGVNLDVFIEATKSAGAAELQSTPMLTGTSDMTSELHIGDTFILPNTQPILAAGGVVGYFPPGTPGQAPAGGTAGYGQAVQGGYGSSGQAGSGTNPLQLQTVGGYTSFQTGTRLRVTPYAIGNNEVRVRLELIRDGGALSPSGTSITGATQTATTDVIVGSDMPIVIGGLTTTARTRTRGGVPFLSALPIVGAFFSSREFAEQQSDLIIVVTPHIHPEVEAAPPPEGLAGSTE